MPAPARISGKAAPIWIAGALAIDPAEIQESFVRAAGPGGQHVNTTSTAVQLRFDVRHSPSLPDDVRQRLERLAGRRLTRDGVLVLLAQGERSQKRNREEALDRLIALIRSRRPSAGAAQEDQDAQGQQAPPPRRQEASRHRQVAAGKTVARLINWGLSSARRGSYCRPPQTKGATRDRRTQGDRQSRRSERAGRQAVGRADPAVARAFQHRQGPHPARDDHVLCRPEEGRGQRQP